MSARGVQGQVGKWRIRWTQAPRSPNGTGQVEVEGVGIVDVSWRKDSDGVWLELPYGVFGFDFQGDRDEDGQILYEASQRGTHRSGGGLIFHRAGEATSVASSALAKRGTRIRAQMPGKVTQVLVKSGQTVEKGQPLIVMEAMKMENEIRAPQGGKLDKVHVSEGQAVETGADLCLINPL